MANFCKKCGSPLDQNTGLCPKCNQTNHHKTANSSAPKKIVKKKNNAIIKIFIIILALFMIGSITYCALVYFDVIKNDIINEYYISFGLKSDDDQLDERTKSGKDETSALSETETETEDVTYNAMSFDVEEYFDENAEIINKINAKTSKDVFSEADAYKEFVDRGFDKYPITTEYSMDGTYFETTEIDQNSTDKHPIYGTYYVDKDDNLWSVSLINGCFFATPITYNLENVEQQVILSETDTLISYDGNSNTFFETIPNESVYQIMNVDKIASKTLSNNDLLEEY